MRTLLIAGTAITALLGADAASAGQRMVQHGPGMMHGSWNAPRPMPHPMPPMGQPHGTRWGSKVGGRWWGGVNAPGGWNAYRRPARGWALPVYWNTPRFYISDWSTYGLAQPQYGYHWVRYYDDAVLVDGHGSIYDSVDGVNWDGYDSDDGQGGYRDERVYADGDRYAPPPPPPPAPAPDYRDDRYAPPPPPPPPAPAYRDDRRGSGLGGAAVGAVAGGVAGNLIAGHGNRLGGTLIGAGVGAAAGYAIDRSSDRGRRPRPLPDDGYGADYPPPALAYAPPPPPRRPLPPMAPPPGHWTSPDGTTTVVTSSGGYYGGSTTTVTVQTAPVVTTTTTEIYEDAVTWSRPRHKVWKPRRKVVCACR